MWMAGALAFFVVLSVLSISRVNVPAPAAWLEALTKWVATVVAIVVSARVLWAGAEVLSKFAK